MFVNEDNCRKLLKTLKRSNSSTELTFLASDSWGAKIHPVYGHELVAEGAVTLLPKRRVIEGKFNVSKGSQTKAAEVKWYNISHFPKQ